MCSERRPEPDRMRAKTLTRSLIPRVPRPIDNQTGVKSDRAALRIRPGYWLVRAFWHVDVRMGIRDDKADGQCRGLNAHRWTSSTLMPPTESVSM